MIRINTNNKTSDMKTRNEMNLKIANIVTEAIEAAKMEANYYGKVATYEGFLIELDVLLMSISFENETAKNMFKGICESKLKSIDPDFKDLVQTKTAMDCNGNYTTNRELWV